jgi:hypothetical protein
MKSTSAQLTPIQERRRGVAISVGLKLLPPLNAFLKAARDAGGDALPYIEAALHRVGPLFEQVWTIAGNLAQILLELAKDAAPFAQALAKIAAAVVVGPLMLFLNVLQSLTQFLADHQGIVEAVAAVYLAKLIPALIAPGSGCRDRHPRGPGDRRRSGGRGAAALGADIAMSKLNASMNLAASAGLAAAVFVAVRSFQGLDESAQKSAETMKKFRDDFRATDLHHTSDQITELTKYVDEGEKVAQEYGVRVGSGPGRVQPGSRRRVDLQGAEAGRRREEDDRGVRGGGGERERQPDRGRARHRPHERGPRGARGETEHRPV